MIDLLAVQEAFQGRGKRFFNLHFPQSPTPAALVLPQYFEGYEAVSRDFCWTLTVLSDSTESPIDLGTNLTIELLGDQGVPRFFNGYVFESRQTGSDGGYTFYQLTLGPWLRILTLRHDTRVFHHQNLLNQLKTIFATYPQADWGVDFKSEPPHYTDACQYNESDHNYVHRRLEQHGWMYWYSHRKDGHTLMLSDRAGTSQPIADAFQVRFQHEAGSLEQDGIHRWHPQRVAVPKALSVSSFDFKKPYPQESASQSVAQASLGGEVYRYAGHYRFESRADAQQTATREIERIESRGQLYEAQSNVRALQAGRWFELVDHPQDAIECVVLEVTHHAHNNYLMRQRSSPNYQNTAVCVPRALSWRPEVGRASQPTHIFGVQTATVVGPQGEEIHTDEYGRVRVQFHWDRLGQMNERSSAWVRVSTAWAGSNFGMISLPRVGQEVIVQFLDGNPDRPLITGSVYNTNNMPPWTLPDNKTQSGILSRSSTGAGYEHANAIRFEDKKGAEQLWLHAEKDQLTEVEHDEDKWVGNDRRKTIDRDETVTVGRDETIQVGHDRSESVGHDETIQIGHDRLESVGHNESIQVGANRTESVGRNESVAIGQHRKHQIGGNHTITVGGFQNETIALASMQSVGLAHVQNIGAAHLVNVGASQMTTIGLMQKTTVGQVAQLSAGRGITLEAGESITLKAGASILVLHASGKISLNGVTVKIVGSELVDLDGQLIDLN